MRKNSNHHICEEDFFLQGKFLVILNFHDKYAESYFFDTIRIAGEKKPFVFFRLFFQNLPKEFFSDANIIDLLVYINAIFAKKIFFEMFTYADKENKIVVKRSLFN